MLILILNIIIVGIVFHRLAVKYDKSEMLTGLVGIIVFVTITFSTGLWFFEFLGSLGIRTGKIGSFSFNVAKYFIGTLVTVIFYYILKNYWSPKKNIIKRDDILDN